MGGPPLYAADQGPDGLMLTIFLSFFLAGLAWHLSRWLVRASVLVFLGLIAKGGVARVTGSSKKKGKAGS